MRVLVTRARKDAEGTAARLAASGRDALFAPVIEIVPTDTALPDEPFDAIIATSRHALDGVILPDALRGAAWLVVGERLAVVLRAHGVGEAEIIAPDVSALLVAIDERYTEPFRFLYLAGRDRKPDLEAGLTRRGHQLRVVETYEALPTPAFAPDVIAAIRDRLIDVVLHYSRRSAELFVRLSAAAGLDDAVRETQHIAISADAAAPLVAQGWRAEIAETPDEAAMLAKLGAQNTRTSS